jgi:hypothetical protein
MRTANGGSGSRLFGKRFDENVVLVDRDAIRWLGRRFVDSMVLVDSCGTPDGPLCVGAGTGLPDRVLAVACCRQRLPTPALACPHNEPGEDGAK